MSFVGWLSNILKGSGGNQDPSIESPPPEHPTPASLQHTLDNFAGCMDLTHRKLPEVGVEMIYFDHLMGNDEFTREITIPFSNVRAEEAGKLLERSQYVKTTDSKAVIQGILEGQIAIFHQDDIYMINLYRPEARSISQSETETVINGPHDSFVESANLNLSLIRRRMKSPHLKVVKLKVGEVTGTDVYVLYLDGIANQQLVDEMIKRIKMVEIDAVHDGNMLIQYIDDFPNSIFPLFPTTERTDSAVSKLASGRIIGIVDGSPAVFSAPASFFEFFSSPDDYYQRWMLGSAIRILRLVAFIITVTFTALYVSVTTFHYEMIPEDLLMTITESRARVPFPPLYEALLMEVTIELLREAGARLPTKIGQTIGIVGGIVIGQAAVQAGLTSNILIIAVASSAIASFVIPSYVMSASIRLIRFGLIILAGLVGNMGLLMGFALIVIHLAGLTSLTTSYLSPVAPFEPRDWRDVFIRAPFWALKQRPSQSNSPNAVKNRIKK